MFNKVFESFLDWAERRRHIVTPEELMLRKLSAASEGLSAAALVGRRYGSLDAIDLVLALKGLTEMGKIKRIGDEYQITSAGRHWLVKIDKA